MSSTSQTDRSLPTPAAQATATGAALRSAIIGITAFLTVVDLFATQAILPSLAKAYGVTAGAMGLAVNASTIGMAVSGLVVGFLSPHIDRRAGVLASLLLLSIPTVLLASAPNLTVFATLRIAQGLCMASAFTLTLAYLGEECSTMDAGGAFAAYITGNVASNLLGRLISAAVADSFGLASNFYFFALLNLAGAILVYFTLRSASPVPAVAAASENAPWIALRNHLRNPALRAAFAIGFCILFAFIGTFTFINFILVRPPLMLDRMQLGYVYFVFAPSIVTTLLAGPAVGVLGTRSAIRLGLGGALAGLPLLLTQSLPLILAGMVLVAAGTFFAQAVATGFVGQAAHDNRGIASGLYLACYFLGGLIGTAVLGRLFDAFGWLICVAGIGAALIVAAAVAARLEAADA